MTESYVGRVPFRAARWYWEARMPDGTYVSGWTLTRWGARRAILTAQGSTDA